MGGISCRWFLTTNINRIFVKSKGYKLTKEYVEGVSVALATFNGGLYLRQQLDSILSQSLRPVDIVISDDGSTDDTLTILLEYQQKYDFIQVVNNPVGGINNNFVNAIKSCRAQWVALCDQDDIWSSEKLYSLYSKRFNAEIVYSRSQLISDTGQPLPVLAEEYLGFGNYQHGRVCPLYFFNSNCVSGHSMMINRRVVDKALPIPDGLMFDQWFALVASCKGSIEFIDRPLTLHRIHDTNSNNNQTARIIEKNSRKSLPKTQKFAAKREKTLRLIERVEPFEFAMCDLDKQILSKYRRHIVLSSNAVIDIPFFLFLIGVRHRIFSHKSFKKVLQESLGRRYYKLLDCVLLR